MAKYDWAWSAWTTTDDVLGLVLRITGGYEGSPSGINAINETIPVTSVEAAKEYTKFWAKKFAEWCEFVKKNNWNEMHYFKEKNGEMEEVYPFG